MSLPAVRATAFQAIPPGGALGASPPCAIVPFDGAARAARAWGSEPTPACAPPSDPASRTTLSNTEPPTDDLHARIARLEGMLSPDGTLRCRGILIMDAHGAPRIVASVSERGEAVLEWLDSGARKRVTVSADGDGSAGLMVFDARGAARIGVGSDRAGGAHVVCSDGARVPRIVVGTSHSGAAAVTVSDGAGQVRVSAGTTADGRVAGDWKVEARGL